MHVGRQNCGRSTWTEVELFPMVLGYLGAPELELVEGQPLGEVEEGA